MRTIKCLKGNWCMPRHAQAMKVQRIFWSCGQAACQNSRRRLAELASKVAPMAGKSFRTRRGRKAVEVHCTGMIAQVAALGWAFVRTAEAMTAEELQAYIRATERLDTTAVSPDAVQYVRAIFRRELDAREAGKLVHIPNPPGFDPETF